MELSSYEQLTLELAIKHRMNSIAHELKFLGNKIPIGLEVRAREEYKTLQRIGEKFGLNLSELESLD